MCASQFVAVRSVANAFEYSDTLSGPFGMSWVTAGSVPVRCDLSPVGRH